MWRLVVLGLLATSGMLGVLPSQNALAASPSNLATSSSSQAYQRSAQDKVAYLHDGSVLVGYFDGSQAVIVQVKNPSTAPTTQQVQTISGDEVTLYTTTGASSTDIWIQVGAELVGSAPLEQIQHGSYDGSSFTWDSVTTIPGTITPGRQDPSVTWTGKWLIASWWDDTNFGNSDNFFMNWTTDKSGRSGWLSSAIRLTSTGTNIVQGSIRHSAKLGATIAVYGGHYRMFTRTLLDSRTDPSLSNWSSETRIDPGYDDSLAGYGGPQIAIDESSGKIHVFRAVTTAGGPSWAGVTYWLGRPDAVPMVSGHVSWNSRLVIDSAANDTDPPDIAGAVDSAGKVFVFWVTSVSSGSLKYATLVSPYTSASGITTLPTDSQPRYPHVPAQAPLSRGYVPLVYQTGSGPFNIVLDTSISAGGSPPPPPPPDTTPPTVPTGLGATVGTRQLSLSWNASTDDVAVTGYTIYRNGSVLSTVSGSTLTYTDTAVASLTTYTYTVDAFDAAGLHSSQSAPVSLTTPNWGPPAGAAKFVHSGVITTGSRVTSVTMTLGPVAQGDLLVGWFGQYDSAGQVSVSDSVNGAWTRSASTTWRGGSAPGDIALYYFANSAAAAGGLTVTITSTGATYLQGAASEYSGVATVNPLDQVKVGVGSGTTADSGLTAAVAAGELVYGGMTATNNAGTLTPGSSQGVTFVSRGQSGSGTQGEEDILVGAAGQQHAVISFPTSGPWFIACAVFKPA